MSGLDPHILTAWAYVVIPCALGWGIWRMRPVILPPMAMAVALLFMAFILSCAFDHFAHGHVQMDSGIAWIEAFISWVTALVLAFNTRVIGETVERTLPDTYMQAMWKRADDQMGLGRSVWFKDHTIWADNITRRNWGVPPAKNENDYEERLEYQDWRDAIESEQEVEQAQTDIADALAGGGISHQLITYKNGRIIYAGGTARANGFAWAGVNIDVTDLVAAMRERYGAAIMRAAELKDKRRQKEIDALRSKLRKVNKQQIARIERGLGDDGS